VRDEFLQDAVILEKDARAFAGAPLEAQLPRFTANVAALDRLLDPLIAPSTAADSERTAEQRHRELMEEVRRGQRDLADLLLEYLRHLLARALRPLGVAVPRVAPVSSAPAHAVNDDVEEEQDDDEEDEE
jgi:hypothetical protein